MDDSVRVCVCVPHCVDFELYYVHAFLSINVRLSKKAYNIYKNDR